jgi:hypothetical protein
VTPTPTATATPTAAPSPIGGPNPSGDCRPFLGATLQSAILRLVPATSAMLCNPGP